MPTERGFIRNLKAYTRGRLTINDLPQLEEEMYSNSARATVLMLTAVLDTCLTILIRDQMRPSLSSDDEKQIFEGRGPLNDLSSKIILGFAFNLYGPNTKKDIDLIRTLRNEFAHSRRHFGFSTPVVSEFCQHLQSPDWPGATIPHGYLASVRHEDLPAATDKSNPRTRFVTAVHTISERLLNNQKMEGIMRAGPLDLP
jgi:DNA-binding MltR family transcriptional regulator